MRAFIALEVPGEIKDRIEEAESGLVLRGVVFVRKGAMHITLQFLGEIDGKEAELAADAMRSIDAAPFRVGLRGLSFFPPEARVVFAKVDDGQGEISDIYRKLGAALSARGISQARENYVPHLTVARVKGQADQRAVLGAINGRSATDFGSFLARSIVLKRSVLGPEGPAYTDLYEREL
jgi:2'-5' RNA ligase